MSLAAIDHIENILNSSPVSVSQSGCCWFLLSVAVVCLCSCRASLIKEKFDGERMRKCGCCCCCCCGGGAGAGAGGVGASAQLLSVCDCYDFTSSDQTACVTVIVQRI